LGKVGPIYRFFFFFKENNGYQRVKKLGSGAFGCVYLVVKEAKDLKHYAIKEFNNSLINAKIFASYKNEWEKLRKISGHPSLLDFIESFEDNGQFYIVTEFCEVKYAFLKFYLGFNLFINISTKLK
jgi:serine/threonine protein kinase